MCSAHGPLWQEVGGLDAYHLSTRPVGSLMTTAQEGSLFFLSLGFGNQSRVDSGALTPGYFSILVVHQSMFK